MLLSHVLIRCNNIRVRCSLMKTLFSFFSMFIPIFFFSLALCCVVATDFIDYIENNKRFFVSFLSAVCFFSVFVRESVFFFFHIAYLRVVSHHKIHSRADRSTLIAVCFVWADLRRRYHYIQYDRIYIFE